MKKMLMLMSIIMVVVACFFVTGCGNSKKAEIPADSPYIGTWEATKVEFKGEEQDINEVLDKGKYTIKLNADGTAVSEYGETVNARWEITKNGVKLTDGVRMKLEDNDGVLSTKIIGLTLYFEKQ